MKIDIAEDDLFALRAIVADGRAASNRYAPTTLTPGITDRGDKLAAKFIRKLNAALKKRYGHDLNGQYYLAKDKRAQFPHHIKKNLPPWPDETQS